MQGSEGACRGVRGHAGDRSEGACGGVRGHAGE